MKLFVLRCGEIDGEGTVVGRQNLKLNEGGQKYAESMAQSLSSIPMTDIYTSPLSRSFGVGLRILEEQPIETCKLVSDYALTDVDYGTLTGERLDNADVLYHLAEPFIKFPHGESYMDVITRVFNFMNNLKEQYSVHDRIVIVTHEPVIQAIEVYCKGMAATELIYARKQFGGIIQYNL